MKGDKSKKVFTVLFIVIILAIIYISRSMIKPLMLSVILAYLINPLTEFLIKKGINKKIAVAITIITLLGFIFLGIFYLIPGVLRDMLEFLKNTGSYSEGVNKYIDNLGYNRLPQYLKNVIDSNLERLENSMVQYMNTILNDIINFTMELPTYSLTPVFVYYFLIDRDYFLGILKSLFPMRVRNKVVELGHEIDKVIGGFLKSQVILSVVIAIFTFVALFALKIRYALVIAIINGLTNIIPYFGPVIGLVPALLAALTQSFNKAILVAVVFFAIQELESSIIAPKLMGDTIGIHPVIIMIVLILAGKYFGGWGLVLCIPAAGAVKVAYGYVIRNLY